MTKNKYESKTAITKVDNALTQNIREVNALIAKQKANVETLFKGANKKFTDLTKITGELKKQIEIDVNQARHFIQEITVGLKEGNSC